MAIYRDETGFSCKCYGKNWNGIQTMIYELVQKAMELLLAGEDEMLAALRHQYQESQLLSIKFTGVGAYINYYIPEPAVNLPFSCHFCFGDIEGKIETLDHEVGFLICIRDGKLSVLEIYTYDEHWSPSGNEEFSLNYIGGKRDMEKLRKAWS